MIVFVHGQVMFPYLIFVILRFVAWKIFFGKLEQKNWNSLFFRFLCSKRRQKSDGSCNDSSDVRFLMQTFQKSNLFDTAKTYEPYFVCNDYFIVNHWDKLWILLNGSYRNKLLGDTDELLQKLNAFYSTYQYLDCLYILFEYQLSPKTVAGKGHVFHNVRRAVYFNKNNGEVNKLSSLTKKAMVIKKYKMHFLRSFQKKKPTQTARSVFAKRIEVIKKTNFEMELIKIVDWLLDGYDNYVITIPFWYQRLKSASYRCFLKNQ